MENLPLEILEKILIDPNLSIRDVLNVSETCQQYHTLINGSNLIWKRKFFDYSPLYKKHFSWNDGEFLEKVKYMYNVQSRAREILQTMSPRFYKRHELSDIDLDEWNTFLNSSPTVYPFLVHYLSGLLNVNTPPIDSPDTIPFHTPGNKTLQYYSSKVLRFIRQQYLTQIWHNYVAMAPNKRILEIGAAFVAQWCKPAAEVDLDSISSKLDRIALHVRHALQTTNPKHSLFKVPAKELVRWREEILAENQFNAIESRQVMDVLRLVFAQELQFYGNNNEYYVPENSFIDDVLITHQGLPITLAIIFEAVGRRLGLRCDPISHPAQFLLRFCDTYDPNTRDWYYIDVFNGCSIINKGACPQRRFYPTSDQLMPPAKATEVIERMANNLEVSARQQPTGRITRLRSSLELLKLVNPHDISTLVSLARLYMLQNMDTKSLEQFLLSQEFQVPEQALRVVHMLRDYQAHHIRNETDCQVEAAQRTSNLRYAVGMVMTHLYLNYKCVIYDWDPVCLAAAEWQENNNIKKLAHKDKQPFYNVLVEDGSHRYVAQENLQPGVDTGFLYLNEEVGRHFSHFYRTHYVPNAEKEMEYPADKEVRLRFHNVYFGFATAEVPNRVVS